MELPYQVVEICSGDTQFSVSKAYDIEVWMPSVNRYIEISSCYNKKEFMSRRANIKYFDNQQKKDRYVHSITAAGLAVGRTVAAILENFQNEDGSVTVPKALVSYMNGRKIIRKV